MSGDWTYPSLQCVLEYLEANKRIHIASRSPSIQKFEKSIPLHLDELCLQKYYIRLDNISLTFHNQSADFFFENKKIHDNSEEASWNIQEAPVNSENLQIRRSRLPENVYPSFFAEIAISAFLGGRKEIYVRKLNFDVFGSRIVGILSNSNLNVRELKLHNQNSTLSALRVIDPSSFPLKSLWLKSPELDVLTHEMAKTAENLTIHTTNAIPLDSYKDCFQNLSNKNLFVREFSRGGPEEVVHLVQNWIEKPRSFGIICRIGAYSFWLLNSYLKAIRGRFNAHYAKLKGPDTGSPGKFLVIPINSTSEIHIHAINTIFLGVNNHILMKMMPTGSSIPYTSDTSFRNPFVRSVKDAESNLRAYRDGAWKPQARKDIQFCISVVISAGFLAALLFYRK